MTLAQAYILLMASILLEITATGSLKATEGFTRWIPSLISVIAISGCMFLMSHVMNHVLRSNGIKAEAVEFDDWPIITDNNIEFL